MLLAIVATTALAAGSAPPQPDLAAVLQRAGAYVTRFYEQLSAIVAEEDYTQMWDRNSSGSIGVNLAKRRLLSDIALVRPAGSDDWLQFRDVFDVDGAPVRGRDERLTRLFLEPPPTAAEQAARIKAESARYNLGDIERNLNTPLFALQILLPRTQTRFRFKRSSTQDVATIGLSPDIAGAFRTSTEVWVVEYNEVVHPTLIRTGAPVTNKDLPAHGRFWIEPATGRVLMTELRAGNRDVRGTIDVSYQSEPLLGLLVPIEMREEYFDGRGSHITGIATYGKFRQFQVSVDQKFLLKK